MFGARAGNTESYLSVNIYIVLQLVLSMLVVSQWALLFNQYQQFQSNTLSDQSNIANLMTYVHQKDFKFILGGVGSLGTSIGSDQESFSSCPSGKYKDHLSSANIYELKCP
jgi:hypothetical protein